MKVKEVVVVVVMLLVLDLMEEVVITIRKDRASFYTLSRERERVGEV